MTSYLDQSAQTVPRDAATAAKQARNIFGAFPFPNFANPHAQFLVREAGGERTDQQAPGPNAKRLILYPPLPWRQPAPKVGFVSLGCPKALVDSERILTQLRAEGYLVAPHAIRMRTWSVVNTFAASSTPQSDVAGSHRQKRCRERQGHRHWLPWAPRAM